MNQRDEKQIQHTPLLKKIKKKEREAPKQNKQKTPTKEKNKNSAQSRTLKWETIDFKLSTSVWQINVNNTVIA